MDDKGQYSIFVVGPITTVANELVTFFKNDSTCSIMEVDGFANVDANTLKVEPCILVGSIETNEQLSAAIGLLKLLSLKNNRDKIKVILVGKQQFAYIAEAMRALYVTDFITEPVSARTVVFKGRLQLNTIKAAAKSSNSSSRAKTGKSHQKDQGDSSDEINSFYFKNKKINKVNEKFVIEVAGPGPEVGSWEKSDSAEEEEQSWEWKSRSAFNKKVGKAKVYGDKPAYDPETKQWKLSAKVPKLVQEKDGVVTELGVKKNKNGEVELLEKKATTETAKQVKPKIVSPIDEDSEDEAASLAGGNLKAIAAGLKRKLRERELAEQAAKEKALGNQNEALPNGALQVKDGPIAIDEPGKSEAEVAAKQLLKEHERRRLKKPGLSGAPEVNDPEDEDLDSPEANEKRVREVAEGRAKKEKTLADVLAQSDEEASIKERALRLKDSEANAKEKNASAHSEENSDKKSPGIETKADREKQEADAKLKALQERLPEIFAKRRQREEEDKKRQLALREAASQVTKNNAERVKAEQRVADEAKRRLNKTKNEELVSDDSDEDDSSSIMEKRKKRESTNAAALPEEDLLDKKRSKLEAVEDGVAEFHELEENFEKEETPFNLGDLGPGDSTDNGSSTSSALNAEPSKGGINAHDSEILEKEVAWQAKNAAINEQKKLVWFYRDKAEVNSLPGSWIKTTEGYFFLRRKIVTDKIRLVQEALPLLIYLGPREPDFEISGQRWRFLECEPVQIFSSTSIPKSISDYLEQFLVREEFESETESVQGKDLKSYLESNALKAAESAKKELEQGSNCDESLLVGTKDSKLSSADLGDNKEKSDFSLKVDNESENKKSSKSDPSVENIGQRNADAERGKSENPSNGESRKEEMPLLSESSNADPASTDSSDEDALSKLRLVRKNKIREEGPQEDLANSLPKVKQKLVEHEELESKKNSNEGEVDSQLPPVAAARKDAVQADLVPSREKRVDEVSDLPPPEARVASSIDSDQIEGSAKTNQLRHADSPRQDNDPKEEASEEPTLEQPLDPIQESAEDERTDPENTKTGLFAALKKRFSSKKKARADRGTEESALADSEANKKRPDILSSLREQVASKKNALDESVEPSTLGELGSVLPGLIKNDAAEASFERISISPTTNSFLSATSDEAFLASDENNSEKLSPRSTNDFKSRHVRGQLSTLSASASEDSGGPRLSIAEAMARALNESRKDKKTKPESHSGVAVSLLALELGLAQMSNRNLSKERATRLIFDYCSLRLPHLKVSYFEKVNTAYRIKGANENEVEISSDDLMGRIQQQFGVMREIMASDGVLLLFLDSKVEGQRVSAPERSIIDRIGRNYRLSVEDLKPQNRVAA